MGAEMYVGKYSWVHRLVGEVKDPTPEQCADVDVEKDGVRALCVDCREGFRRRVLGLSAREVAEEKIRDEYDRQVQEQAEEGFADALRQAIRKVGDLELRAWVEFPEAMEADGKQVAAFAEGFRPVTESLSNLVQLYKKVTGYEYVDWCQVQTQYLELRRQR